MSAPAGSTASLERRLTTADAAAVVVSNVIGSGILITPAFIAASVPDAWAMLAVWGVGGALAFAGAMAYAELAALRLRAGGEYVYLREAFGPLAAFLTGWTSFVAGFSGAIAASAVGLASYLGRFVPAAGDATPLVSLPIGPLALSPVAAVDRGADGRASAVVGAHPWARTRAPRAGRPGGRQGRHAPRVRGLGPVDRSRRRRPLHLGVAGRVSRLAPGADPCDVQLLGLERGRLRRGGDPGPAAQRPPGARHRHRHWMVRTRSCWRLVPRQ